VAPASSRAGHACGRVDEVARRVARPAAIRLTRTRSALRGRTPCGAEAPASCSEGAPLAGARHCRVWGAGPYGRRHARDLRRAPPARGRRRRPHRHRPAQGGAARGRRPARPRHRGRGAARTARLVLVAPGLSAGARAPGGDVPRSAGGTGVERATTWPCNSLRPRRLGHHPPLRPGRIAAAPPCGPPRPGCYQSASSRRGTARRAGHHRVGALRGIAKWPARARRRCRGAPHAVGEAHDCLPG